MLDTDDIRKVKTRFIDELYGETRRQQGIDLTYIDDTFMPPIRRPHKVVRLGLGADIVNSPAEQIVTSNPQAFIEAKDEEASIRISKVINGWIDILRRQNPNPFKESVKNKLGRGENYIKVVHNESWVTKPIGKGKNKLPIFDRRGLPIIFSVLDPMVIYGSPQEDENGIPETVIVFYERQPEEVIVKYDKWVRPADKQERKPLEWFEFWDAETMHFEASGNEALRTANPYGFPPFVRKYSGLGRRSPDGELANLIVSEIRNSRGLIEEICVMRSDIASVMHLSAHKGKLVTSTGEINKAEVQKIEWGEYGVSVLDHLPPDFKIEDVNVDQPTLEAFQHTAHIMADLTRRHPYIMAGFPSGISGRQQGMTDEAAMARYDTVIENTETEWATAFEMAFKVMKAIPTLLPEGLHKDDLDVAFKCTVRLKAKDPIEEDRLATLGSRLLLNNEIDPMTNLIQFKGYTQTEAKEILVNVLKWKVLLGSPDIAELIGLRAAEKSGMAEDLQVIKARRQQLERQPLGGAMPPTTRERIGGEVRTELGREGEPEGVRGARSPPERFTRGGG